METLDCSAAALDVHPFYLVEDVEQMCKDNDNALSDVSEMVLSRNIKTLDVNQMALERYDLDVRAYLDFSLLTHGGGEDDVHFSKLSA